jgi:hypothetical protein
VGIVRFGGRRSVLHLHEGWREIGPFVQALCNGWAVLFELLHRRLQSAAMNIGDEY